MRTNGFSFTTQKANNDIPGMSGVKNKRLRFFFEVSYTIFFSFAASSARHHHVPQVFLMIVIITFILCIYP